MSRCGTCHVTLDSADAVRAHYNSELHLQNVRRRVDGMRPLMPDEARRVAAHSGAGGGKDKAHDDARSCAGSVAATTTTAGGGGGNGNAAPMFSCTLCRKTFHSVQTLQTHVRSTAHLMRKEQRILARDADAASVLTSTSLGSAAIGLHRRHKAKQSKASRESRKDEAAAAEVSVHAHDRDEDVSEHRCLFCGLLSRDVDENVAHLRHSHAFTIPLLVHCHDVPGLLAYLARKVNGLVCLVCNERTRTYSSLTALRDHMRESGHERIVLGREYAAFYRCALDDAEVPSAPLLHGDEVVVVSQRRHDSNNGSGSRALAATRQLLRLTDGGSSSGGGGTAHGTSDHHHNDGGSGSRRIVRRREADVPRPRPREPEAQAAARHALLASEHEALAVARQEQLALYAPQQHAEVVAMRRQGAAYHAEQLRVGLRSNKLHPKGYDGNMMFS